MSSTQDRRTTELPTFHTNRLALHVGGKEAAEENSADGKPSKADESVGGWLFVALGRPRREGS